MRRLWKHNRLLGLLLIVLLAACNNDSYETGDGSLSYVSAEFCMAHSSASGSLDYALIDDGDSLRLSPAATASWATTPDSLYRTLLYYYATGEKTVRPYAAAQVLVLRPSYSEEVRQLPTDPLTLQSAWVSGDDKYLNLGLQVKTGSASGDLRQTLALSCDSITEFYGRKIFHLQLRHDQNGVPEYYSATAYATIPLDSFPSGSELRLRVQTYDGLITRTIQH